MNNTIPNYSSEIKQFAVKEFIKMLKLPEGDFIFKLNSLAGMTYGEQRKLNSK